MLYPSRPVLRMALALILVGSIVGILSLPLGRRRIPYAQEWAGERKASEGADPEGRYVLCVRWASHC